MRPRKSAPKLLAMTITLALASLAIGSPAEAQERSDDGPVGPYWYFGFRGIPDTFQNPDRDSIFPFYFGWDESTFTDLADNQAYAATGRPGGEIFTYTAPPSNVEVMAGGISMTNPTGFAIAPNGDFWFADYGANQLVRYDAALGTSEVMYDGDVSGQMDGPWDISWGRWFQRPGGSYTMDDIVWEQMFFVASRDNHRILRFNPDGEYQSHYSTGGIREPTHLACDRTNYFDWMNACANFYVTGYASDAMYTLSPDSRYTWQSPRNNLAGPMGTYVGPGGRYITSSDDNMIRRDSWRGDPIMVPASAGLINPTGIVIWDPVPDVLGATWYDWLDRLQYQMTDTKAMYIIDSGGTRMVKVALNDLGTVTEYIAMPPGVERREILIDQLSGDLYALDFDTAAGEASVVRYPASLSLDITTVGFPSEVMLGYSPRGYFQRPFRSWIFDEGEGAEFTVPTRRDRTINIHLGFTDPLAAGPGSLTATVQAEEELSRPILSASGATAGVLRIEVETPIGPRGTEADEVILYQQAGCEAQIALSANRSNLWRSAFQFPNMGTNPTWDLGDLDECAVEVGRYVADPSGVTTIDLDNSGFLPGARYCFVAVQRDFETNTYSDPSVSGASTTCARPPITVDNGVFCSEAIRAEAYSEGSGYALNQMNDPGLPAWFDYTVGGSPGEPRRVFAWVNQPNQFNDERLAPAPRTETLEGGDPLISIFGDCPETGGELVRENRWAVEINAVGGQQLKIRTTHFGEVLPTWMMLDLSENPTAELDAPSNLTATDNRAGEILVCWDPVVEFKGIPLDPDSISYRVSRRLSGQEEFVVVAHHWGAACYLDNRLGPNLDYDYQIETILRMRALRQQLDVLRVESNPTSVSGTTSGNDITGIPLTLASPTNINVRQLDPNDQNFFTSAGTLVWWDAEPEADAYRVSQTLVGAGLQSELIVEGGRPAAEMPGTDLGLLCFDVTALREGGGATVQSAPTGYSVAGDTNYCTNLCEEAADEVTMARVSGVRTPWRRGEALVQRPVEYYVIDPAGYTGLFHLTNSSGNPAEVCAWQGDSSCTNLELLGCGLPNASGNSVLTVEIQNGTLPIYVMWRLIAQGLQTPEDLHAVRFTVGFEEATIAEIGNPTLALDIVDNTCASNVRLDYVASSWEPEFDSFISFRVGGEEATRVTALVGTVDLPVDPRDSLHEIEAVIFNTPLEAAFSRRIYTSTGARTGDIDEDCELTVADVVRLLNHILGSMTLNEIEQVVADVVDDDLLDITDVVSMISTILDNF